MTNAHKALWRDMHQKAPDKLFTGKGDFFPLSLIFIILDSECNGCFCHALDAIVTDGNPMCIFTKIPDHRFCPLKWLLAVRNPFLVVAEI